MTTIPPAPLRGVKNRESWLHKLFDAWFYTIKTKSWRPFARLMLTVLVMVVLMVLRTRGII